MAFIGNTPTTQAFTPAVDYFSGNGSTTAFTLSRSVASVAQVQVVIDNVPQNPNTAYSVSGQTITFTSAPLSGTNNIYVYYTSPITQVIAPSQGSVNTTSLGNITNIASGNSNLTLQTGSSPTTAVTIDTSQNVGIGTSSPQAKVHIGFNTTAPGFGTPSQMVYNIGANQPEFLVRQTTNSIVCSIAADNTGGYVRTATNHDLRFITNNTNQMNLTTGGLLQFNSGYGSVATAYGCRAWVNFNGVTGVSIRGSANVSSVTRSSAGLYIVNFSTAMPDANYAALATCQPNGYGGAFAGTGTTAAGSQTASQTTIEVRNTSNNNTDSDWISFAVFR